MSARFFLWYEGLKPPNRCGDCSMGLELAKTELFSGLWTICWQQVVVDSCWQFKKKGRRTIRNCRAYGNPQEPPNQMFCSLFRDFDQMLSPSKKNIAWMVRGWEKNTQNLGPKKALKLRFYVTLKKTTPTCEHIHILSVLKPPTKQWGIPQNSN